MAHENRPVEDVVKGRIEYVSDEGLVVIVLPTGQRRVTTVARHVVPLVRRLAARDREIDT